MTFDEIRYWQPGPRARPFHFRWLLPAACRQNMRSWQIAQGLSFGALGALLWAYTGEWWACLLILGCSGVLFNLRHPVLVDLPAMALALSAAVLAQAGLWWAAVLLSLLSGMTKETAPVFAASWAWNPVLLVGLLPPLIRLLIPAGVDAIPDGPAHYALNHPVRASWIAHRPQQPWIWVLPWGVLLAAVANGSPQLWVCLALAYAQCIVATDTVRLFQWALPAMALAAAPMLAGPWLALALVVHIVNPFRTEGI